MSIIVRIFVLLFVLACNAIAALRMQPPIGTHNSRVLLKDFALHAISSRVTVAFHAGIRRSLDMLLVNSGEYGKLGDMALLLIRFPHLLVQQGPGLATGGSRSGYLFISPTLDRPLGGALAKGISNFSRVSFNAKANA